MSQREGPARWTTVLPAIHGPVLTSSRRAKSRLSNANRAFWGRDSRRNGTITQRLGVRLEVMRVEKIGLCLYHLGCIDADPREVADHYRKRKNQLDKARRAWERQERAIAQTATTAPMVSPTGWELREKNPRTFVVARLLADLAWWTLPDLVTRAQWFDGFKGLSSDALRRAVHRAADALKRALPVEVGTEGRSKTVGERFRRRPASHHRTRIA